jgi:TolA-binding protein
MKKQYKFLEKENWFKHDFRSREDKKLIKLKMKWKSSAPIGVFWQLCEMIYESAGVLEYDIDVISYNCGDSVELVEDVIKMCFIITDDNHLTHDTIIEQLDVRDASYTEVSERNSKAGKASAEARRLAKELEQQSNDSSTGVQQLFNTTQHNINTTQPEKRVKSKEFREESKELIDKNKLLAVYTAEPSAEIENTDLDYMIDESDYEITRPMLERVIDKFLAVNNRFKFQSVMREIDEDYGGFQNLIELYLPNDNQAQKNFNNALNQYNNGIFHI